MTRIPNKMFFKFSPFKLLVIGSIIIAVWYIIFFTYKGIKITTKIAQYNETEIQRIEQGKRCFRLESNIPQLELLDDVSKSEKAPTPGISIFFHVTSCATNGTIVFSARQACAIESAAKWNPLRDIFVLFASPVGFVPDKPISPIIAAIESYPNVHFRNIDLYSYSDGTPAGDWIKTDKIFMSPYVVSHMLDYLRFLTLYKFGGICLDLDIIALKAFNFMPPNFAGAEKKTLIAVGALGFEAGAIGHQIAEMAVRENIENFQPWENNGPGAITRVLRNICVTKDVAEMQPEICWGLKVFPPSAFYAIYSNKYKLFFDTDPANVSKFLEWTTDSYAVHMWNKLSSTMTIDKTKPKTAYGLIAEQNCPKVYQASGLYF